jgi:hypothetical protein
VERLYQVKQTRGGEDEGKVGFYGFMSFAGHMNNDKSPMSNSEAIWYFTYRNAEP